METVYKIRRKSDGMYSCGGTYPHFNTRGKIWRTASGLSNHIGIVRKASYSDCEIVQYVITETERDTIPMEEYVAAKILRQEEVRLAAQQSKLRRQLESLDVDIYAKMRRIGEERQRIKKTLKEYADKVTL